MLLSTLLLKNFKNHKNTSLKFVNNINVFVGFNGQGKTTIFDAIHYLSLTKSFQNNNDDQNINFDENFFRIEGKFINDIGNEYKVVCVNERNGRKQIIVNDKNVKKFSEHIGNFPIVSITSYDANLIYSSEARRSFIDETISLFDREYLQDLINYNKILQQRNKLIKDYNSVAMASDIIDVYDNKLAHYGNNIHQKRKVFLERIKNIVQKFYNLISEYSENIDIIYESNLINEDFFELLKKNYQRDLLLGHTTVGIHREDFDFLINGHSLKKTGSQGQQKSFLIALKLAKNEYIQQMKKTWPLLLIDDIYDKLDKKRMKKLLEILNCEISSQVFITDTDMDRIKSLIIGISKEIIYYSIENGSAFIVN